MTGAIPADFVEQSSRLTNRGLQALYGVSQPTLSKWRKVTGAVAIGNEQNVAVPVPDDWYEIAPTMSQRQMAGHYGRGKETIRRWVAETGVATDSKPNRGNERPCPADFAARWAEMPQIALMQHYKCGKQAVTRWIVETGLTRSPSARLCTPHAVIRTSRPARSPAPAKLKATFAPVDRAHRDSSRAGQAADYLRRFGPVVRCDARGRYAENGTHWRRGSTVLTADEVVERAVRNGWQPNAWKLVA